MVKILAIDIGGTSIKMGLTDISGEVTHFKEVDTHSKQGGPRMIERIIDIVHAEYRDFDAIGISTAGQVDSDSGKIIYANDNIPGYTGMDLRTAFTEACNVPVRVENDVNAAALGEKHFGAGKEYADFLCLTYGTGIGGAIVMDDQLYKGFTGSAAEFGHMITHPEGDVCTCGRLGCYEMYASTTALVKNASKVNVSYTNGREIFQAIENGDAAMKQVLAEWVKEIAYGIVSLVHIFNPPAIMIGGGIMEQESLVALVREQVKGEIMPSFSSVALVQASLGNKAGLLGAASLHLSK